MKSRKVLTILLSLAIMVTFMPTFAFAAPENLDGHRWDEGTWLVEADKCGDYGVKQYKCEADTFDELKCGDVVNEPERKAHDGAGEMMTPATYVEKLMSQGYYTAKYGRNAAKQAAADAKNLSSGIAGYCQVKAYVCKDCGKIVKPVYDDEDERLVGYSDITKDDDLEAGLSIEDSTHHEYAKGSCVAEPVCNICGVALPSTAEDDHTYAKVTTAPTRDDFTSVTYKNFHGLNIENADNDTMTVYTHKTCGQEAFTAYWTEHDEYLSGGGGSAHNYGSEVTGITPNVTTGYDKYIWVGEKAYNPNKTYVTYVDGVKTTYSYLACEDCGLPYSFTQAGVEDALVGEQQPLEVPFVSNDRHTVWAPAVVTTTTCTHNWNKVSVEATCNNPAMSFEICTICNDTRKESVDEDSQLLHDYKEKVLSSTDCLNDGITVMKCSVCGDEVLVDDTNAEKNAKTGKWYFCYPDGEVNPATGSYTDKYIEIANWHGGADGEGATGHNYGTYEKYADATCTHADLQVKKCKDCGAIDAHNVQTTGKALGHTIEEVVVPATCGAQGYSYKICTTCGKYANKNDKTGATYPLSDEDEFENLKYDYTSPKVKLGAECNFEWKVTKAATETTDGEKALVCTVCGTVKEGSQTLIPADVATAEKKAAVEAATPAVEAAADVIDNAAVYTAKSVKAVEEAKSMLNSAIASGTAADVKAMTENLQKVTQAAVQKSDNTIKVTGKKVKATANKKTKKVTKKQTFKKSKAFKVSGAKGAVTFKKTSGNKKITVAKNGTITVNKGIKKGTYKVGVTATAAGNDNYLSGTADATVTVVIK